MKRALRHALHHGRGWAVLAVLTLTAAVAILVLRSGTTRAADIPDSLVYRGLLTGPDGAAARDGTYGLRLAFYDAAVDGTELCHWTQTTVPMRAGRFQLEVGGTVGSGSCTSVQEVLRGTSDLWVEMAVQDTDGSFLPLRPRLSVGATARAQHAEYAERVADSLALDLVPSGMVAMFRNACPAGWDPVPEMEGRIPRGAATAGATGGSETTAAAGDHTHGINSAGGHAHSTTGAGDHTHGLGFCGGQPDWNWGLMCIRWIGGVYPGGCERINSPSGAGGGHGHDVGSAGEHSHAIASGEAHTHTAMPPATGVVFCRKR